MVGIQEGDALLIIDIQNDFLPGGALGIPDADKVLPVLQQCVDQFERRGLPIFATRDWHPPHHSSFREHGGIWPTHCIAGSPGAAPPSSFHLPPSAKIIHKGIDPLTEGYSGFQGTPLDTQLKKLMVKRLFVGGLATDFCVLNTVNDALDLGYQVYLLSDGIRAVNIHPGDGEKALSDMCRHGAILIDSHQVTG